MNVHKDFDALVEPYLARGLEPSELESFDRHMNDCGDCATALADAQEFDTFMQDSVEPLRPPEDLENRIIGNLRSEGLGRKKRSFSLPRFRTPVWMKVAAVFVLCIGIGILAQQKSDKAPGSVAQREVSEKDGVLEGYTPHPTFGFAMAGEKKLAGAKIKVQAGYGDFHHLEPKFRYADHDELRKNLASVRHSVNPEPQPKKKPNWGEMDEYRESVKEEQKIIRKGDMDFEVVSFDESLKTVHSIVKGDGGYISSTARQKLPNGKVYGTVVIRIPKDKFDTFLIKITALGELKHQNVSAQDVTKQYVDLSSRLKSKHTLEERLLKMLAEGKGELKDLLQVEKELGVVREAIEKIQGELNYYNNLISMSTLTLTMREKDLGRPFEYVQTLKSDVGLVVEDADRAYASAHEIIKNAKGRILDANMTRQKDGMANAYIQAAIDADQFQKVKDGLLGLGDAILDKDTRAQKPVGGQEGDRENAPVRKEQAVIHLTMQSPAIVNTVTANVAVENSDTEKAYRDARAAIEAAGGEIIGGNLTRHANGSNGVIQAKIGAAKFAALVIELKKFGEVKTDTIQQHEIEKKSDLRREMAVIQFRVSTPSRIIESDEGFGAVVRDSIRGILWSLTMLAVGIAYAGPWLLLGILGWFIWKKRQSRKTVAQ